MIMDFAGNNYYNIHRILLSSIGLWPYQNTKMTKIQRIISFIGFMSLIICQLMKFVTTEYSMDLLFKILSFAVPCMVFVLKYVSFCMNIKTVRTLMENVMNDWNSLKTEVELEIIKKYSDSGRLYTLIFASLVYSFSLVYITFQFAPNFFDIVTTQNRNKSQQSHTMPVVAEYFVDQQKYYLPILLHIDSVTLVGFTTVMSTELLFVTYLQHAMGMFEIASYRIEHAFDEVLNVNVSRKDCSYCAKIINAVNIHIRAIRFVEFLQSSFVISYFFLLLLGVASLTVNLFRFFLAACYADDIEELIITALFVSGHIFYIFLGNYIGQKLIDHSTGIFCRTYESQWYIAPLHAQKLILFIMRRSIKSTAVSLGGIFIPSLEGFATITSMALSYFAVIRSVL